MAKSSWKSGLGRNTAANVQRRSSTLATISTLVLVALIAALCLEAFGLVWMEHPRDAFGFKLAQRLPMLFYLWAIWTIRSAFALLSRGDLFDHVLPSMLHRIGWALALGAFANVIASPMLLRMFDEPDNRGFANFDPAAITLGVVGLMLAVVARLLSQAAAMRDELDAIL